MPVISNVKNVAYLLISCIFDFLLKLEGRKIHLETWAMFHPQMYKLVALVHMFLWLNSRHAKNDNNLYL